LPPSEFGHFHFKEGAGVGMFHFGNLLGGAFCNYFPSFVASFGADIDNPVAVFYDVEIVLYDNDAVPFIDEFPQNFKQVLDILEVQAGGRLVENVEGFTGLYFSKFGRELDALCFAA